MRPRAVPYYIVALDLHGKKAVVIGDGPLAEEKAQALLEAGAEVDLISKEPTAVVTALARSNKITLHRRRFAKGDLRRAFLAIAALPDRTANSRIRSEAEANGVLLNSVDDMENCHFIAPAILRRGEVTVAVSTGGASPALAVRLRQAIARLVRPEHGRLASLLGDLRGEVARRVADPARRKQLWFDIVDSGVLALVARGRDEDARTAIEQLVRQCGEPDPLGAGRVKTGSVTLVGAGPGSPDLITVAGLRALRAADAVVYDRLVHPALLSVAPAHARRIFAGKRPRGTATPQCWINETLIGLAREGLNVVRLKGGDPFVFGRGMEECEALRAENVAVRVIPGVSAALAAPAAAGISVTHREHSSAFVVVTGEQSSSASPIEWGAVARIPTIVVLMGLGQLAAILERLIENGLPPDTPAAMISSATLARQRVVRGTVYTLPRAVAAAGIHSPATLVVGDVLGAKAVPVESVEYSR